MSLLHRVGEWAASLGPEALPPAVAHKTRLQIATSLAAAGASPWHAASRRVLEARRSAGPALVVATGDRMAPADAAYVNAAFAMSLDFDDYMLCAHTGYSAVLAPLGWARTVDDLVVAAAAANEVMGRLSTACFYGPLNGQMTSYVHNAGAALAVGLARGLDAKALADAVGLALCQPSYCLVPGFWHEPTKTLTASTPLDQGVRAVDLALAGLTAPPDLLEHRLGFLASFSFGSFPHLFDGLGETWFAHTLCYKRFPGTSYISAAVEGALQATGGEPLRAADVGRVLVDTTVLSAKLDGLGDAALDRTPLDANAVNFSLKLSVAAALHFGTLDPDVLRPERLEPAEGAIRALASKVVVRHDLDQTLRMVAESPLGVRMLRDLGPAGIARVVRHARRMGGRAEGGGRARAVLGNLTRLLRAARGPVSDRAFDAPSFRMLQSARTTVESGGAPRTVWVSIPEGACGRDADETERLVQWRLDEAFGKAAAGAWSALHRPGATVEALLAPIAT